VIVRTISIDTLVNLLIKRRVLKRVDLIKIDVEGAELDVLLGATNTLSRFKPILQIEVKKDNEEVVLSLLEKHGYKVLKLGVVDFIAIPTNLELKDVFQVS